MMIYLTLRAERTTLPAMQRRTGPRNGRLSPIRLLACVALALLWACAGAQGSAGGAGNGSGPATPVELPGVDSTNLTAREKSEWSGHVSELLAPCPDQPVSVATCVEQKRPCGLCVPAAKFLVKQVSKGKTSSQVETAFRLRFAPEAKKTLDLSGSPSKGAPDAPIVIAEWADFECPFCGNAAPVLDDLVKAHAGSIRLVFKHYPLAMHKHAEKAARAAIAADRQGKFWEMHHLLFENAPNLDPPALTRLAQKAGLDPTKFQSDLDGEATTQVIERDRKQADALGLHSTPMIFINGRQFDLEHFKLDEDLKDWIELELEIAGKKPVAMAPAASVK
jgi:protein-disulfide isomerase